MLSLISNATTNTYDSLARRVIESEDLGGDGQIDAVLQYVYGCASLWEVIERIQLAAGTQANEQLLTTHVYGLGIDDEVSYRIEDVASPEDVWTHRDDLGSLTSITNDAGLVLERYEYGDYGLVTIFDTNGDVLASTQYYAVHLYTGRSMIAGTGLYDYRWRVMDPWSGRFNQRDPLWYIDSMNAYAFVISNPMRFIDPYGAMIDPGWVRRREQQQLRQRDGKVISDRRLQLPNDNFWVIGIGVGTREELIDKLNNGPSSNKYRICRIASHCGLEGTFVLPGPKTDDGKPYVENFTLDDFKNLDSDPFEGFEGPPSPQDCSRYERWQRLKEVLDTLDKNCDKVIFEQCKSGGGEKGKELQHIIDERYPDTEWVLPEGIWNDNPIWPYDAGPGGGKW